MGADVAAGLAYVCTHLGELRELLGDEGADPATPLGRLLALSGAPGEDPELASLLAEVDSVLRESTDGMVSLHGFGQGRDGSGLEALEFVYRCPLRRCAGRPGGEVAEARPVCSISRRALLRERLF
ncbi:hypothetical protein [Streptomyces sp. NPDC059247]|uniref:hypothetical protein n=1 Tax=Streptomyces sp. NPDC059247 TaxID=3346790 RepID=UPI003675F1ED